MDWKLELVPVLCGSAFKKRGVQPLVDAVVDYLTSPLDVPPPVGLAPGTEEKISNPDGMIIGADGGGRLGWFDDLFRRHNATGADSNCRPDRVKSRGMSTQRYFNRIGFRAALVFAGHSFLSVMIA